MPPRLRGDLIRLHGNVRGMPRRYCRPLSILLCYENTFRGARFSIWTRADEVMLCSCPQRFERGMMPHENVAISIENSQSEKYRGRLFRNLSSTQLKNWRWDAKRVT
jgi:hypothetical protein